jgi:transposase
MPKSASIEIAVIGIDIGKNSFHVVGHDKRGSIVLRQKWSRGQIEARLANMPPCLIGMEACVGAHHLARKLSGLGHDARLMPAKYVRPYAKGQKNDFNDAEAIAEAVQRPTMKFVATKTADQLDLQALHRVRERLVSQRTGVINQIRAFMLERGIAVRQGLRFLRAELPIILASRTDVLSPRMLRVIEDLAGDWRRLDERIDNLSREIETIARQDAGCDCLMSVPAWEAGVGTHYCNEDSLSLRFYQASQSIGNITEKNVKYKKYNSGKRGFTHETSIRTRGHHAARTAAARLAVRLPTQNMR